MSYENAPATKLLATHCLCCERPLVDAKSVEIGIGPVCRKKYVFDKNIGDKARQACNKLVYEGAALTTKSDGNYIARILEIADEIEAYGLDELAEKVRTRFIEIRLVKDGEAILLFTPFSYEWLDTFKRWVDWRDREFDRTKKAWKVSPYGHRKLLGALAAQFPGAYAMGPKGVFEVPDLETYKAKYEKEPRS